jgi:probable FeS assembly SUF system protein SufT
MSFADEIELTRDTSATIIPSGDEYTLPSGTKVSISQALGGSVTVRTETGLYRISGADIDALGESVQDTLRAGVEADKHVSPDEPFSEEKVWEAMKGCFDPEIPVNVVDLGLIYDLQIESPGGDEAPHAVKIKMTLTAQGCGMGPVIADDVKKSVESLSSVGEAQVEIVWDPPWTPHMISEAGRKKLGIE